MNDRTHTPHAYATPPRATDPGNEPRWEIEDVTARADVSERLVRHCEARGLLAGAARAGASRRRYTHDDISVLRFVRRTHVLGFGMNETAQLLSLWRGGQPPAPAHILHRLVQAHPDQQQPSCPILEALMQAGRQQRSSPGPLP
ncbi:Cu(I)-responsive transcriptional regulator [Achromobacter marplatensis]|uniref:MerR-like DNA binding protein n=1 Tax=Achromobacter marplatensis TaxID=470868 RepID=A0ABX9GIV1_9BURK|nr:MerR family transcriptional regulator [Achromobacter marplatensis]OWT72431.1 Cu(I)-responsive transcriptional regulator [Achromobacter marplatensis]RBP24270.1 MerR-like DNA binding protein [Achromobacter marplatensis]CAB3627423.1 HTH-type transcriptional regulator HmrR [Achromobacter marplatensis]